MHKNNLCMYNIKYIRSVTRGMPFGVCIKYSKTMKIKLTIKKLKLSNWQIENRNM